MFSRRYAAEEGAYVVVPGRDTIRDVEIPVLDGTALLLCKQPRSRGDGDIELLFVGDEINLEAVKPRVFVGTRDGSRLVEMAVIVSRDLSNPRNHVEFLVGLLEIVRTSSQCPLAVKALAFSDWCPCQTIYRMVW